MKDKSTNFAVKISIELNSLIGGCVNRSLKKHYNSTITKRYNE